LASTGPSRFIEQHASLIDARLPVLDAPCGLGRNSLFLAERGYQVIGVDIDHERIRFVASRARSEPRFEKNLRLAACDLNAESLPFAEASFGTLLIVHFIPERCRNYLALLRSGGYLLFETMGGQGANYLQLPRVGQMRALLEPAFTMSLYRERPVGPPEVNAVTVRLIARRI
jgi:SAM-dependent methyltransferase